MPDTSHITRRDFVGTTLLGAGAALLGAPSPAAQTPGWDGFGGVGDYSRANGNVADVVTAAHRIRDHAYDGPLPDVTDTGEAYDVIVVGAGFTGLGALHHIKTNLPNRTALLLDNQSVFGGFAKANEFDIDGLRLAGPQASINFIEPRTAEDRANSYFDAFGLPDRFRFAGAQGCDPAIRFQRSTSGVLYRGEQCATVGYHFQNEGWVKDIWDGDLARAPWPAAMKDGLLRLRQRKQEGKPDGAEAARLDSMTFADYARELGVAADVLPYITLGMCITGPQISALGAFSFPGIGRFAPGTPQAEFGDRFVSFPGGNTTLARHFVHAIRPDAMPTIDAPIDAAALDTPGACRFRLGATVVRVQHIGPPEAADRVAVTYARDGRLFQVTGKAVVMAIGHWVGKHVVAGLPPARRVALDQFLYAPILMANVALRNWRFLDRLGFSAARWFDGFGFYATIRQPMLTGGRAPPFHPDSPIVMTFYVPIQAPGLPLLAQGPAARARLLATSYADYERLLLDQMQTLFAPGGFDAPRDVAGIVLNRWGHAFVTPPPHFFTGKDGAPAPVTLAIQPFGRIVFGQTGLEDWLSAAHAGRRAATDITPML